MRTHKRASGVPPSPVTLAEWVNGGACPPEALHEAGRLHVDLTMLAPLSMKYGTDVQMDENTYDRVALNRLVVNVDSISFRWRDDPIPMSDCLNSIPLAGDDATSETENELMADAWNSIPLKDRVIRADWDDLQNWRLKRGRRNNSSLDKLHSLEDDSSLDKLHPLEDDSSLDDLARRWNDTPETVRPAHFPLDPVVGAFVGSPVSLIDYLPTFRRYQQDVRRAVDRDKEMNGQSAHNALLESVRPDIEKHDRLIGLLRAAAAGSRQNRVGEGIKNLIPKLGTLDDVNHSRVVSALEYAIGSKRSYSTNWQRSYYKARATKKD